MTTVFEVHFNLPDEFIEELNHDAAETRIPDMIARCSLRISHANREQLTGGIERNDRPLVNWRRHIVEASYVSASGQLVKLSTFLGYEFIDGVSGMDQPTAGRDPTAATLEAERDALGRLKRAFDNIPNLKVRKGGLYVEAGAWVATEFEQIVAPPRYACATCFEEIYEANGAWRHKGTGQADVFDVVACPECNGTREVPYRGSKTRSKRCDRCKITPGERRTLNHIADPVVVGRKV